MKTKLLILSVVLMLPVFVFSQSSQGAVDYEKKRQEIYAQKMAFITQKVGMTPEEAQKFWPYYNELESKKTQLSKEYWTLYAKMKKNEATFEQVNQKKIDQIVKEAELDKEYYQKYKTVLSDEKIFNLYRAERDFQKELLEKMHQK